LLIHIHLHTNNQCGLIGREFASMGNNYPNLSKLGQILICTCLKWFEVKISPQQSSICCDFLNYLQNISGHTAGNKTLWFFPTISIFRYFFIFSSFASFFLCSSLCVSICQQVCPLWCRFSNICKYAAYSILNANLQRVPEETLCQNFTDIIVLFFDR
jgi:hypothetical protein